MNRDFCVVFLPWVWRTWDGYMHFRLEAFLPFTDFFILSYCWFCSLISPSFPLLPLFPQLVNNQIVWSLFLKQHWWRYTRRKVQCAVNPEAIFLAAFLKFQVFPIQKEEGEVGGGTTEHLQPSCWYYLLTSHVFCQNSTISGKHKAQGVSASHAFLLSKL